MSDAEAGRAEAVRQLHTVVSTRLFIASILTIILFRIPYAVLLVNTFWFPTDVRWWTVPSILLLFAAAHLLLLWQETPAGCRFFAPIFHGSPPIVYYKWLTLGKSALAIGDRQVLYGAIDALNLTFWGNVQICSRALRGDETLVAGQDKDKLDIVLKVPMGAARLEDQKLFVEEVKKHRPDVVINKRLAKRLASPVVPGATNALLFGAIFITLYVFDVAQATLGYLENLKEYHLAAEAAAKGDKAKAEEHLKVGDDIRLSPFPFSLANKTLLTDGSAAADILVARAYALFYMGRKAEAVKSCQEAEKFDAKDFRVSLSLARFLAENGEHKAARVQLAKIIDEHVGSLVARMYMVALLEGDNKAALAKRFYEIYKEDLDNELYGEEPMWPPGQHKAPWENWYREDMHFVFDKLVRSQR